MKSKVSAKWIRMSPRKVRRVADLIRGKQVDEALNILHFSPKAASVPLEKALRSAIANLMNIEDKSKVRSEDLFVDEARVDQGITLKRIRAASMGRAMRIRKRTSHITLVVSDGE
ncbi:50S ribosomal protein L22 [candidate division KSB1 bacterium]|nr:50S ribosomal protein L22 [candidate division KSB1 bacterium]